jgi:hypothetical protein
LKRTANTAPSCPFRTLVSFVGSTLLVEDDDEAIHAFTFTNYFSISVAAE